MGTEDAEHRPARRKREKDRAAKPRSGAPYRQPAPKSEPDAPEIASPAAAARPRKALAAGGTLLPLGLALVGIGPSELGMGITLLSLVVLIYGVHSFGRLGPA